MANYFEPIKVKVRTGPVDPYYLRLRPRLSLWQRVRLLFGATLTTFVELDQASGCYRVRCYLDGQSVPTDLDYGDKWEALAPGGLLSPSQEDRFCELLTRPAEPPSFEEAIAGAAQMRSVREALEDMEKTP